MSELPEGSSRPEKSDVEIDGAEGREEENLGFQDFEAALKRLEEIVSQLESGDLSLEKSIENFEEGMKISRFCGEKLNEAERKVELLVKDAKGGMKEAAFETESDDDL